MNKYFNYFVLKVNEINDIKNYIKNDRLLFQRQNDILKMNIKELYQEYNSLQLILTYYKYNYYLNNNLFPKDKEFEKLTKVLKKLKEMIILKEKKEKNLNFYKINSGNFNLLPKSISNLADYISIIQTKIIELNEIINELKGDDLKILSIKKCLICEQKHYLKMNNIIKYNINEIISQLNNY